MIFKLLLGLFHSPGSNPHSIISASLCLPTLPLPQHNMQKAPTSPKPNQHQFPYIWLVIANSHLPSVKSRSLNCSSTQPVSCRYLSQVQNLNSELYPGKFFSERERKHTKAKVRFHSAECNQSIQHSRFMNACMSIHAKEHRKASFVQILVGIYTALMTKKIKIKILS